jgi:hypothetical protein
LEADTGFDGFDPAWSHSREAAAHLYAGRLDRSMEIYAHLAAQSGLAQVMGRCGQLSALPLAGRDEEARAIAEDTLTAARAHANPWCIATALWGSGGAFVQTDPGRALRFFRDGLVYAEQHRLSFFEAAFAQTSAGLEAAHGDLGQALAVFEAALDRLHRAGHVASLASTFAILAVCFDRFDQPDVAATLYGASTNQAVSMYTVDLPAVVDHLRAVLGDAAFDQCAATGAAMDLADAVEYARDHIELARRQAANTDSGRT